jgi:hypothetical protein
MRIDEGLRHHWAEPDEADLIQQLREHRGQQAPMHEQPTTPPPPEPPLTAFWEPAPVPPNALNDLPPAPQSQAAAEGAAGATQAVAETTASETQAAAETAAIATQGAAETSATAAQTSPQTTPPPATPSAATYAGEPTADPQWLVDRENALVAIRAGYSAALSQARSTAGVGPGWTAATTVSDESGQLRSASGREMVFVADPNAPQVIVGYDESGPVYQPAGQWMEFDEEVFAAHYRADLDGFGGAHLQSLATLYGTDVAGLFAQHPEIWGIATSDHAINAGPPPAGRAMGDPSQLGMLDLYMRDPQMAALIDAYGGQPAPAAGDIAREQVRIYGQQRYDQLNRLDNAMESVRQQYTDAMAQAQASGSGPGWVERASTITVSDESGQTSTQALYITDESGQPLRDASGQPQAQMERLFDPDAFTAWYVQQGGLQHEAFKDLYGQSHTTFATDESGRSVAAAIRFDNPNWSMGGVGGMVHKDLVGIDPNDPPRLHDREAIGFDLEAGWATHHSNIKPERDWFETVVQVAMVAVVSYISAGQLGPAAASAMGLTTTTATGATVLTTAGVMVSGAVAGAATSIASGMMSGNLTFKGVLQGALAGGLSGGLIKELGPIAASAGPVGTLALRTTVQGGIQALLGGEFKDGALAGFASGLADLAGANMEANIDKAVSAQAMTAAEAVTARNFARVIRSAIRAAGSPDDPTNAFASSFLNDLIQQVGPAPGTLMAVADEGQIVPNDPVSQRDQEWIDQSDDILFRRGEEIAEANGLNGVELEDGRIRLPDGRVVTPTVTVRELQPAEPCSGPDSPAPPAETSIYPDRYRSVAGAPGVMPVGGFDGLSLARDLPTLAPELTPTLADGRPGVGVPYRDEAGQVFYRTFDANGEAVGWVSAPVAAASLPFVARFAPVAQGVLAAELAYGPPPLKLMAGATLAAGTGLAAWWAAENADELLRRDALTPEQVRELQQPMINVPPPPAGPEVISTPPLGPEDRQLVDGPITTPITLPQPTVIPGSPMEPQTIDELIITSRGFEPGTAEHKAATWDQYEARGGDWSYERWSSVYDANQTRAAQANAAVDEYHRSLAWGAREVTIDQITVDGEQTSRRLDIADTFSQKGLEYKTGYQTATVDNMWELQRDAQLVRLGWDIEWVFRDRASAPLLEALRNAGIRVTGGE